MNKEFLKWLKSHDPKIKWDELNLKGIEEDLNSVVKISGNLDLTKVKEAFEKAYPREEYLKRFSVLLRRGDIKHQIYSPYYLENSLYSILASLECFLDDIEKYDR